MTRLLLFTNDYPYRTGDVVFVEKEIEALAAAFDDVVVFCHARSTSAGMVELPGNVRFGANLFAPARADRARWRLTPRAVGDLVSASWREIRAGCLRGHLRLFLQGAWVGIGQARHRAVRAAIAEAPETVAYAFWGMGGGLGLAWLHGVAGRVVRLHRYDLFEELSPEGYLPFRPQLFARADRVLAISDDGVRYLADTYDSADLDGRTELSRLGVFGPSEVRRDVRGRERVVVSCSSVTDIKRVGLILEALVQLPGLSTEAPVRWVHFGYGPRMPDLREAASAAPDGLTVELRGQVPNSEVLAFYESERVDVFVNASSSEGVPMSIMEAIAHDIPVVATEVGGASEIVGAALGSGELLPADPTPATVAAMLRRVLDAPDDAYAPRALWSRRYDAAITGARAAELVRSVLKR